MRDVQIFTAKIVDHFQLNFVRRALYSSFNPFDDNKKEDEDRSSSSSAASTSSTAVFDRTPFEDKAVWESKRKSILSLASDTFIYGMKDRDLSAKYGLVAAPKLPGAAAAAAATEETTPAIAAESSPSARSSLPPDTVEVPVAELPANLVVGPDGIPRLVLYKAPRLPFHAIRTLMAMAIPISIFAMIAGKMVFVTASGSSVSSLELVSQLSYSIIFWGLVAMPQLFGPNFIGEISVIPQAHKVRLGLLNWRGKRKDIDVPLLGFHPSMMEMTEAEKQDLWGRPIVGLVKVTGHRLPLFVSLKHGEFPNKQMFLNLLEGKVHERYLQRMKAEQEMETAEGQGQEEAGSAARAEG